MFAETPFPQEQRSSWPKVSVLVCARDAADTIEDCLSSLEQLNYPSFQIIVVNDGSQDATGEIARRHSSVRVIDIPKGGLSVARNAALSHATGEIVAYTDADVRVDPDWLTYLIQPFLKWDVVGSGGPSVVPPDDPWMAQCIARSPGGPTHVMFDDFIAEHVPGCNMAFRREALLELGGFNPIYICAGDDVDVCWRFQASGHQIGFAPSALVWHHHRPTLGAYWRQQVGYGKSETWLMQNHPEKFLAGHARWQGRIYSPLPFVRSISDRRINTGVWGTAGFPSVYHAGSHRIALLPHQARWQVLSAALAVSGALVLLTPQSTTAVLLLSLGAMGLGVTCARCMRYALRSDIDGLPTIGGAPERVSRVVYRAMITALHFLQPLARATGRVWGMLVRPVGNDTKPISSQAKADIRLSMEVRRVARLITGRRVQERFWSERWIERTEVLARLAQRLRSARIGRMVEIDDGWQEHHDLGIALGHWGWVDVLSLIEDHGTGRCLLRVALRLRITAVGAAVIFLLGLAGGIGISLGAAVGKAITVGVAGALMLWVGRRLAGVTAVVRKSVAKVARGLGMEKMDALGAVVDADSPAESSSGTEPVAVGGELGVDGLGSSRDGQPAFTRERLSTPPVIDPVQGASTVPDARSALGGAVRRAGEAGSADRGSEEAGALTGDPVPASSGGSAHVNGRPKVVVLGMMSRHPVAGIVWLTMQYVVGLTRLGYDVYYVETHGGTPKWFMTEGDDGTVRAAAFVSAVFERFGMQDKWAYHAVHGEGRVYGMSADALSALYRNAAAIFNLHGGTTPLPEHTATGRLVYIGTDPVEREVKLQENDSEITELFSAHCAHFTWGENYGHADCKVPVSDRFTLMPTRQPILLDVWQTGRNGGGTLFTTVGSWRQLWRDVTVNGEHYTWSKHHEFLKFLDLPRCAGQRFELALSGCEDADRRVLEDHGWQVRDALAMSADLDDY